MAGLSWVHWLGLLLAVASSGAQIFPFSNLKHMFEQKGKAGQGAARAPPPVTTPSPLGSPGFVPTLEPSTTTLEPTTTVGPVSGLAPYYGPYSLFDEDDGYREFQRPDLVVTERARPLPKASKPTAAAKPKHQAAATHPKYSPSATKQTPPSRLAASKPTATAAAGQQAKHKKRLVESHLHAVPPAGRPSHYVPIKIAAAESSAAAAIALGPPQRTPANHRPGLRPQPQHQQQLQQQAPRAPKFKNHKQGPVAAPSAPRPVKYHNHRPGSLDGEESSTSLRYRKRPLGPIEQEVASSGIQHTGKYPSSGDGDRVEFQMHGLQGPESYKFGYDTGSGHNRQFRYEERDPHGNVKGHYGYVDEHGKLQIVNYKADPHHGYSADVSKLHT